ncbi:succinate dehydrogenase assembly factor 2, mitochondrial-like [Venturia canescens]|uniref:succinate dehydrogenase assembly factor 2, mitochondrial-like n=1 Tax=Venturia canescens TaxID=32260 RepID=UPI001C9C26E1|nr:succinate dehydrogenase assembly factor 2, mitochondrial-like [Venturia canescens]XP_043268570.1 succinate dehydrogenase assembly factor 2, mitochondrial-like [Venturia canescens]XP_043268571.1 succinate dehydrogenase assembly factor 2, mitochondrial-like [Venturia canescens]
MNIALKSSLALVRPLHHARAISVSAIPARSYDDLHHPEGREPSIPQYVEREGESAELKRARLVYQSRKRGMLENGLLLSTFAKKYLDTFDDNQLRMYDRLINLPSNDWDIFNWAVGVKPTPAEFDHEIMDLLKKHIQNEDRQARIMQPAL